MKKIIIEHEIESKEDEIDFEITMKAKDMLFVLYELNDLFRSIFKHGPQDRKLNDLLENQAVTIKDKDGMETTIPHEVIDRMWDLYREILEEHNVDLDRLMW